MAGAHFEFEFFTGVSVLVLLGAGWAHLAVKLDRLQRHSNRHGVCLKRMRLRLAKVESWLPKTRNRPYEDTT